MEIRKFNIYKTIDFFAVLLYYRGRRKSYEINLSLVWRKRLYSAKLHKADTGYYGGRYRRVRRTRRQRVER